MKTLILLMLFALTSQTYAQYPKAQEIQVKVKDKAYSHKATITKAVLSEAWDIVHFPHDGKENDSQFLSAEKLSFNGMKWKVNFLFSENMISVWFFFYNSDKSMKGLQESELGNVEKSLLSEIKKIPN